MGKMNQELADFRTETAWAQREFLKTLRRGQARSEALCPSVFTLTPAAGKSYRPGIQRMELRLYCEQPGAFHALREPPYIVSQPVRWLTTISPYLATLVAVLKHTAPLVAPILGLAAEQLANQLTNEVSLMTELINQLPGIGQIAERIFFRRKIRDIRLNWRRITVRFMPFCTSWILAITGPDSAVSSVRRTRFSGFVASMLSNTISSCWVFPDVL